MIQRYEFIREIDGSSIEEDPNGDWVKWEDVKGMVDVKCNCEEMFERVKYAFADGSDADWFCPAHGYKKR